MTSDLPPGPPLAPLPEAPAATTWTWPSEPAADPTPVDGPAVPASPTMLQSLKTVAGTAVVVAVGLLTAAFGYRAITHHATPASATTPATVTNDGGGQVPQLPQQDPAFDRGPRGPYGGPYGGRYGDPGDDDDGNVGGGRPPGQFGG